jgi:hypothetical protein
VNTPLPVPQIAPNQMAAGLFRLWLRLKDAPRDRERFYKSLWFNVHTSMDQEEVEACRKVIQRINEAEAGQ